jgi:hypothetical protein
MSVEPWVEELTEDGLPQSSMKIGEIIRHPEGRYVKVIDGRLGGEDGYSNFWFWREVLPDGRLGRLEHCYGW